MSPEEPAGPIPPATPDFGEQAVRSARVEPPVPARPARTGELPPPGGVDGDLQALADACGVATGYQNAEGEEVHVAADTVRAVLRLLDVDPDDPVAALDAVRETPWLRQLPAAAVVSAATPAPVVVHLPADVSAVAELVLESGQRILLGPLGEPSDRRDVEGELWVACPIALPAELPLGDHLLRVGVPYPDGGVQVLLCTVIAVPDAVPIPRGLRDKPSAPGGAAPSGGTTGGTEQSRAWGWMIQLYAVRSVNSWGMGDYADLAELAAWSAADSADVLLVNPLHAAAPTVPVAASPYSPVSRRFAAPLYLRPQDTPEYDQAAPQVRAEVEALAQRARDARRPAGLLDRDAVWQAKLAALELLFDVAQRTATATATDADADDADDATDGLADFATWCALAERHGPDWRVWPAGLAHPDGPDVAAARVELADRIAFHAWLQRRCDDQLAAAQRAARAAGMAVGIVHDLAVGVDPGGADAWALQDVLAVEARVGAPPDAFNQQGQDWGLPPWRPQALAEAGYAPLRRMVAAVLRRGGGLRVDHILGLFRLWWIPGGASAAQGTYVRYDAAAMLGLIALEAARADALVVGEDLGTVEASVVSTLSRTGVLGSTILWFERDAEGAPLPPQRYRPATMASLTTHDLPTAAGYLEGEHVRVRARLGQLGRSEQAERDAWRAERDDLVALLHAEGLLPGALPTARDAQGGAAAGEQYSAAVRADLVLALHRMLVRSPCQVVLAAPGDALGDLHQPNLPGTTDSYPNWRLPVRDGDGVEVTVERLCADPAVARLAALLAEVRTHHSGPPG